MKILSILFTVLALVAAGGSGGVYFLTKGKLEEANAELKSTRGSLDTAQDELGKAKTQILSTEQLLKNTRSELADAKQQSSSLSRKLVSLQTTAQEAQDKITSLEGQVSEAQKDNANLRKELLTRANAQPEDNGGASAEEVEAFKTEIAELEEKVSSLESQMASGAVAPSPAVMAAASPNSGASASFSTVPTGNIEGTIARVNSQSGILVLAKGSDHGIQPNGEYTLKKSGYVLAKVRVTKLTPDHTVATIIPNIGIPNSLRIGDSVDITR
ncbi:MAG: hypothetical protein ACPGN3_03150 [Opitutales bacterium]